MTKKLQNVQFVNIREKNNLINMKETYEKIAKQCRIKCLELIYKAQTSHIGSVMSCVEILTVLFEKADPQKDEVVLSAGWKAAAWYYFLWRKGIISEEELNSFCQEGSKFIGLVEPQNCQECDGTGIDKISKKCNGSGKRWGLKCAGGSMGLSLPAAVGIALAKKLKNEKGKVYVLMSDGEMQCGTTWESALIAAQHKLDNLVVLLDYNMLQAMGRTNQILNIEPLRDKWTMFNWQVCGTSRLNPMDEEYADGHDFIDIEGWLNWPQVAPKIIIFKTIKGKGVSFMANNNDWHYLNISKEDYEKALKELQNA